MYGKTMCTEKGDPLPGMIGNSVSCGHRRKGCKLTSDDNHINDVNDARVFEGFEDLDFSESSDRHPFLLVVHEDPLQGDGPPCSFLDRFMYLTRKGVKGKTPCQKESPTRTFLPLIWL